MSRVGWTSMQLLHGSGSKGWMTNQNVLRSYGAVNDRWSLVVEHLKRAQERFAQLEEYFPVEGFGPVCASIPNPVRLWLGVGNVYRFKKYSSSVPRQSSITTHILGSMHIP